MSFRAIVTLGPSILNHVGRLEEIHELGDCIFRINGAHSDADQTRATIQRCREWVPDCTLMVDLPGNKVRTGVLDQVIPLVAGEEITIRPDQLNFPGVHEHLQIGDVVLAHDAMYRLVVQWVNENEITLLSHSDGYLTSNRGLHVDGLSGHMPFLFQRDVDLITVACKEKVSFISLSFVRNAGDIEKARRFINDRHTTYALNPRPKIIAKIETRAALGNLDSIITNADAVNLDRGDLSADVGLLDVPAAQARVTDRALDAKRDIYVATQFLSHMVESPVPLIAEVLDVHRTIESGVTGIQLSEETAVGRHPVACVEMIFKILRSAC